ncbi:PEP-CTERM sorting domain-containing protein, partial [Chamaesiphon sp. OTE_75_metabat_556]|uniref:PEP-CTERM sorting domain-containing protein n=1 Tax=Chamaesiphon sp. OTE_75_metabat_556 TaxID=2964692 RepID=UPI00286CAC05
PVNSTNFGLSATSETLYAFLGTSDTTPTTLLTAVSTESADTLGIVGLTNGVNAIRLTPSADFAEFNGSRTNQASFANYRTSVNTASNWNINVDGDGTSVVPNSTRFSLAASAAVPEPTDFLGTIVALCAVAIFKRKFSTNKLDR